MTQFKMVYALMLALLFALVACTSHHRGEDRSDRDSTRTSEETKRSGGEYVDDAVITTKVKAAIIKEDNLKSSEINVETYKGVVQLSGFVSSEADIALATKVASQVEGVTSVKNDMRLKPN
jgi:osmotically-inducible protein OsmY